MEVLDAMWRWEFVLLALRKLDWAHRFQRHRYSVECYLGPLGFAVIGMRVRPDRNIWFPDLERTGSVFCT
jgi:hypothetical protein